MEAASTAETIGGTVFVVSSIALLGMLVALGLLGRFPTSLARFDAWAFANPRSYAAVVAIASSFPFLLLALIPYVGLLLAPLALGLWFCFNGWSMSSGPGRKRHDRRMRGGTFRATRRSPY